MPLKVICGGDEEKKIIYLKPMPSYKDFGTPP